MDYPRLANLEESRTSFNFLQLWLREAAFTDNKVYRAYGMLQGHFQRLPFQDSWSSYTNPHTVILRAERPFQKWLSHGFSCIVTGVITSWSLLERSLSMGCLSLLCPFPLLTIPKHLLETTLTRDWLEY